jgi:hypothetical protein
VQDTRRCARRRYLYSIGPKPRNFKPLGPDKTLLVWKDRAMLRMVKRAALGLIGLSKSA